MPLLKTFDLTILCAGALHAAMEELLENFDSIAKMKIDVRFANSAGVRTRILAGEEVDVAVTTQAALNELHELNKLLPGSSLPLARSAIGIAVRAGASKPDIGSAELFKHVLRKAQTIAIAEPAGGSPSAIHFLHVVERLGLTSELQPKLRLATGGSGGVVVVGKLVADGEAEIAIQQVAEILAVPGIDLVGKLPAELQHITVFSGAIVASSQQIANARRLVNFLGSAFAASILEANGMEPA